MDRVCRSCIVVIQGHETWANLLLLDMLDFDIILGMDWLSLHHEIFDYYAETVTLAIPGIPPVLAG